MFRTIIRRCSSLESTMVRVLNVAEKNDAAKSLSELMSRGGYRRRDGFSPYNKIYEFEYNILNQQNVTMTMTSLSGHMLNFEFSGSYRKWYSCNPVALFEAPVSKECPQDYQKIKRTLEREARGCQTLIIWTDCDREGENIGYEVIQVCTSVKPNLRVYRAKFSEITPASVQRACANLIPPNKNVSDAVDVRQELDLRIGAAFTRFQTMRLQKVFPTVLSEQLISYGSCQFPTLGFVVERYKQVQAFVPEPFWKIAVHHDTEDGAVEFLWKRSRLFDHIACLTLYNHCLETPLARVTEVKSRPKSKWRPQALDTVELEKLASRKLKVSAKETMKIAEKLYTQGFISYPRTETNIFPKELDLRPLVQAQSEDNRWGEFAAGVLERGPTPRSGNKSDQAHPPIHPLKYTNALQGNEAKIYEFIVRHFLACCSQDAQGQETTVEIDIADEQFSASGLMIIARNYLDVYPYDRWTAKVIPRFERGEEFQPKAIEMNQGETSPPQLLSESDLIALMDKHGIGTDATHAEHIETIKSRLYVGVRPDGKFVPGELGMGLVEGYDAIGYGMSKPNLRAELEADLKEICEGRKNPEEVLLRQIQNYKQVFVEAVQQADKIDVALSEYFGEAQQYNAPDIHQEVSTPVKKCPNCGQDMLIKVKKDGKGYFLSCMGYPDCRNAVWFPDSVLSASTEDAVCETCDGSPHLVKFKFKRGSVPAYMPLEYVGCVGGCDADLREVLGLRMQPPSQPAPSQRNSRHNDSGFGGSLGNNRAPRGRNGPQGGGRGGPQGGGRGGSQGGGRGGPQGGGRGGSQGGGRGSQDSGFGSQSRSFTSQASVRQPLATLPIAGGQRVAPTPHTGGDTAFVCSCGEDARQLTVRKEGPNTGRQFYVCPKPQDVKCNFFMWADEAQPADGEGTGGSTAPSYGGNSRNTSGGSTNTGFNSMGNNNNNRPSWGGPSAGGVQCNCGEPGKPLVVQKEGPNKGRPFYGCPKPRGQGCNFFQWQDEDEGNNTRNNYSSGRGRGGGNKKTGPPQGSKEQGGKRKMTCSACGQQGHRRNKCPSSMS